MRVEWAVEGEPLGANVFIKKRVNYFFMFI